jgi:hypothetical protein
MAAASFGGLSSHGLRLTEFNNPSENIPPKRRFFHGKEVNKYGYKNIVG